MQKKAYLLSFGERISRTLDLDEPHLALLKVPNAGCQLKARKDLADSHQVWHATRAVPVLLTQHAADGSHGPSAHTREDLLQLAVAKVPSHADGPGAARTFTAVSLAEHFEGSLGRLHLLEALIDESGASASKAVFTQVKGSRLVPSFERAWDGLEEDWPHEEREQCCEDGGLCVIPAS